MLAATCFLPVYALNPAFRTSQYLHTAWKSDSGLQGARRIAQTPDGYLWLATRAGLVRFDGARFTTYLAGSVPGLESSTTTDLVVDRDGSLWIATLVGGVSHYQHGKFRSYSTRDGLPSNDIRSMFQDSRGVIWVGTDEGKIARLNHDRFESASLGIQAPDITAFLEDGDHSLWITTFGNGVFRLRDGVLTPFSVGEGVPDVRVAGICRDRSGKIWTVGIKGVSSWDGERFVPHSAINRFVNYGNACRQDRDGNLWIAAKNGLFRVQGDRIEKLDRTSGLSDNFTFDVFEDRDGSLWAVTLGGLDRMLDGPIRTFGAKEGLIGDPGPVAADHAAVWTTFEGQVDRIGASGLSTWRLTLPSAAQTVMPLSSPDSEFLIGFNSGVVRWRPNGKAAAIPALGGLDVDCLLKARDGIIWIGTTNRGLLRLKSSSGSGMSLDVVVANKSISALAEDHTGAIWAGGHFGGGLYRITGKKVEHFGQPEGLKSSDVYSVFADDQGDLWIGSSAGLSWFHNGELRTVDSRQGLLSNPVFAIVDDSYGRLWIATSAGLACMDRKSLKDRAEGRLARLNPTVYRATDETRMRALGYNFPRAVRLDDGHLWFAFATGVSEVIPPVPGAMPEDNFPLLIEYVKVDGVSHERPDRLRIPPGARSIEIAYTAIDLTNPESIHFRYRLTGADPASVDADTRRVAFYGNLKPGTYTFTVSASRGEEQWRESPALVLEQLPYFYQTQWFALLASATALSLAFFVYRLRLQQAVDRIQAGFQARMQERTRIAQELHDTVVQAISGSMMLVENAAEKVPESLPVVKGALLRAVDRLDVALAESRAALKGLRISGTLENNLAKQLSDVAGDTWTPDIAFRL
jgi:ligand-binding sensor domain-containing protein